MITFHTIVRGFAGEFDRIQRNAIGSWLRLVPTPEVLLFGDDEPGAKEFAAEAGLPIYPLKRNHRGIPLVGWPIQQARELAHNDVRCLVNADIILTQPFVRAIRAVAEKLDRFLALPKRYDLEVLGLLDFSPGWQVRLAKEAEHARYKGPLAVDVFCYRGGFWGDVPAFAVGRTSWDNWLVRKALQEHIPVVDISEWAVCIHQVHSKHRDGDETAENRALLGGGRAAGFVDATWRLTRAGLEKMK